MVLSIISFGISCKDCANSKFVLNADIFGNFLLSESNNIICFAINSSSAFEFFWISLFSSKIKLNTSKILEAFSSLSCATSLNWLTTFVFFSTGKGNTPWSICPSVQSFPIASVSTSFIVASCFATGAVGSTTSNVSVSTAGDSSSSIPSILAKISSIFSSPSVSSWLSSILLMISSISSSDALDSTSVDGSSTAISSTGASSAGISVCAIKSAISSSDIDSLSSCGSSTAGISSGAGVSSSGISNPLISASISSWLILITKPF